MKETELHHKDKVEIVKQTKQEKKEVRVKQMKPQPGHSLFEYNPTENTIRLATYAEQAVNYEDAVKGNIVTQKKLQITKGNIYVAALNYRNAIKRISRMRGKINPTIIK